MGMATETVPEVRRKFSASEISRYLTCPRQHYFAYVLGLEPKETSYAALEGIAYHDAISAWHLFKRQEPAETMVRDFERKLRSGVEKARGEGLDITGFAGDPSIEESITEAVELLTAYHADPRHAVELVVNEQRFEVEVQGPGKTAYLFGGYIDQVRRHPDQSLHLADLKSGETRPNDFLLKLDVQLSLYALAMQKGRFFVRDREVPPTEIAQQPQSLALVMLKDYRRRKKNEFAEFTTHETETEINPVTKRKNKKKIQNPRFVEGYKVGDLYGPVFYRTTRTLYDLRQAELDLARVCAAIRRREFFRRPSAHGSCIGFCRFTEECVQERAEPI
jgi:hypothetical protein